MKTNKKVSSDARLWKQGTVLAWCAALVLLTLSHPVWLAWLIVGLLLSGSALAFSFKKQDEEMFALSLLILSIILDLTIGKLVQLSALPEAKRKFRLFPLITFAYGMWQEYLQEKQEGEEEA